MFCLVKRRKNNCNNEVCVMIHSFNFSSLNLFTSDAFDLLPLFFSDIVNLLSLCKIPNISGETISS